MYKLIRHRGIFAEETKENSYEAIKKALESEKYVGVEFDIRETKDNEIILYHNAFYNSKLVSNTYYKEMPKYVPKLEDILKINSNKMFLIEIKNIENNYDKFINLLKKYEEKNIYVMSFSRKVINKIDIKGRKYKIGILNYILNTNEDINKLDFVGILNSLLSDEILSKLKKLDVFSYGLFENKKYIQVFYIVNN